MHFDGPFTLSEATEREWLLPNGLGGYASSTLCGMNTRRYHGLLVAALRPPAQRTVLVAKLEEEVIHGQQTYALATNQYPGTYYPQGYQYLERFSLDATAVTMVFAAGSALLEKTITTTPGENTTHVAYRNVGDVPFQLRITPLVNARDFHGETAEGSIHFDVQATVLKSGPRVCVRPGWMPDGYWLAADGGSWQGQADWYRNMFYIWERRRGLTAIDNHFSPGCFTHTLEPDQCWTIVLSTEEPPQRRRKSHTAPQLAKPGQADDPPEIRQLARTAESFLVQRAAVDGQRLAQGRTVIAGYHWFGDWGRDTMIALPGLCLTTGHAREAAEILRTFAAARRRGLLPNLFMESGQGEAFNTVDAALWFVNAVHEYYSATQDAALVEELRPALDEIITYYRNGTDYGISMDRDGLMIAASPGWQLTWMDAKVGDWVVTPRMGKPVEISALWYNALRIMEEFARACNWEGEYGALAERVRKGFAAFWYAEGQYLYDVLDTPPDTRLRPNQIFAVSLPYSPLDLNQARAVVSMVERHLLTPYGLRSLAPYDKEYHGHYGGNTWERDSAYHQGTVWGWLIGPYIDAYLRVHGHSEQAKLLCRALLKPMLAHVWEAGVGSISEIFEGNPPHLPRGTVSQAWSVSEVLRVWQKCRTS